METITSAIDDLPAYAVLLAVGVLLILLLIVLGMLQRYRAQLRQAAYLERMVKLIQPDAGLENNLNLLLETISPIVDAHGYAFYIRDSEEGDFMLKAVRHRGQDPVQIGPSYSGLLPYQKEVYLPPLHIKADQSSQTLGVIHAGDVPLYNMPVGKRGLVRIGPIPRLSRGQRERLAAISSLLPQLVDVLAESERLQLKADVVETSRAALQAISSMVMDQEAVVSKAFMMSQAALGVSGGCLFVSDHGTVSMPVFFGWSQQIADRLADPSQLSMLIQLMSPHELVLWDKDDEEFDQVVSLLGGIGDGLLASGTLPLPGKKAWFICGLPLHAASDMTREQVTTTLTMMARELARLLAVQERMKPFAYSYSEFLKLLASTIDDLNPQTIGYSQLMSRYAIILAKELGLPPKQIRDIGTAAYLSNIGVLGLSEELYLKEGRFTEIEYEKMKLHVEVGAAIAETTLGSREIADAIRYHHERIDGQGYPLGLEGQAIPIGARIISVVQTFLAKVNGRRYRDPLPFDQAIKSMESLAGTQLDSDVVQALIRWFERSHSGAQSPAGT
ncbi:HD-GYP domain-containing protein (c-di-GMP phosphodiesterase class II) [Paenibacillus phyllosphaerae]|uniref:HD-GYP domain-containing protein (C-di-GMP phosphodiesterase class II) n=1 Tax=Paenibacillus phyllosphaerae TaxID=274593 RepID=A0A7W5AU68_9BACL|nr:HD domain-containing phosphohydrolase [Paenibacillus phyllosphaerae]MBB3108742.1 HD-GYP domain-containing protein (c-di-GMP phosphodiesterase class II) [Paenibacillus phyllosphaerae]